jgi:hypothetical protein
MSYQRWEYERGRRELYFDSDTGEIETDNGIQLTVDEARELWLAGDFTDTTISFHRLATEFEFDVAACLKWYAEQD